MDTEQTDVVIVGSGPTGLMAAALLTRCGVRVRIFDKGEQQAHESRAFGVHAKSLELFLNIGLADEMLEKGFIATGAQIFVDGQQAAELNLDDLGRNDTPYSYVLMVPQWDIEAILVKDLQRLGVEVEHNVEVIGFTQSAAGVAVQAKTKAGESIEARAAYLIGADGAYSIVRKTLGLTFEGAPYETGFRLADCKIDWPLDYEHIKLFLSGRHMAVYLPLRGKDICRIIVVKPLDAPATAATAEAGGAEPANLADAQAALRAASGMDITLRDPTWVSDYRIHHRGVNRYSQGRVFVAGDAAHIHSPAGGQGMNTGLQDAANLAWKIALANKGHAPAALLETYHAERWPIGQYILKYTDRLFAGMSSQKGWVTSLRNHLFPLLAGTLSKSGTVRSKAFHFLSQLGIHYHDNEFLRDEMSADAPRAWREGLTAGRRAPNGLAGRNQDVFGLISGYRFHVLAFSRKPLSCDEIAKLSEELAALPKSIGVDLQTHIIAHSLVGRDPRILRAESSQAFEAYDVTHETPQALYLIRPDGYIAYRSNRLDVAALSAFLGRFCGRHFDA